MQTLVVISDEIRVLISASETEFERKSHFEEDKISFAKRCRQVHSFVCGQWALLLKLCTDLSNLRSTVTSSSSSSPSFENRSDEIEVGLLQLRPHSGRCAGTSKWKLNIVLLTLDLETFSSPLGVWVTFSPRAFATPSRS